MFSSKLRIATLAVSLLVTSASTLEAQSLSVSHFAGTLGGGGYDDGTGTAARFSALIGLAFAPDGNLYITDRGNHTIRRATPAGVVTLFAGSPGETGTADGTLLAARFNFPNGMVSDSAGNLFVVDGHNFTIRRIGTNGIVTTIAGSPGISGSADGTGSAARFLFPRGIAIDPSGNLYVADSDNHTIRKVTPAGVVTTLAGQAGSPGSVNDLGGRARFNLPTDVASDAAGNIYVTDRNNNAIRRITPSGAVTTFAGGTRGYADGTGGLARFSGPIGLAFDTAGNLFVGDFNNQVIRRITPAAVVSTFAGTPGVAGAADGTATQASFNGPWRLTLDTAGNVYVADLLSSTLRKISPAGVVTTFAGLVAAAGSTDATGTDARFNRPEGVALDGPGNLFVADTGNHTIRKITPAGVVTTFAGLAGSAGSTDGTGTAALFSFPTRIAIDSAGSLYISDSGNNTIRKITQAGVVTTLAGSPGSFGSADGTGAGARFNDPRGLAVDTMGSVFVADRSNHTIRRVTSAGVVTTLAGTAGTSGSADGTGAAALFLVPADIAIDSAGNLFVADSLNYTVRKITSSGVVTTFAGTAGASGTVDGIGAAARFGPGFGDAGPTGIAVDGSGNVFVADGGTNVIRKITPAGLVRTVAGGMGSGATDRVGSLARFSSPAGIAARGGSVYIADRDNNAIRLGVEGPIGDANGDVSVSVADVFYLINRLFVGGPAPIGTGDSNGDGTVSVADVFYLINFLFTSGPAPR